MIRSTMQDFPLTIGAIMRHGARVYGGSECVTWTGVGARLPRAGRMFYDGRFESPK